MGDISQRVPIVDLAESAATGEAGKELCKALREVGFAYIKNHGVPEETIQEAFSWSRKFFNLPQDEKDKSPHPPEGWYHRGYSSIGREKVSQNVFDKDGLEYLRTIPDQKESFELDFYSVCNGLEAKLLTAVATGLDLPPDYFDRCHRGRQNQLRLLHYPPFAAELLESGKADCIAAHSDFGTLTLLFQDEVGGLEIEDQQNSGKFRPVPYIPGTIVVNTGDMLTRWTNDELRSTIHRVRTPSDAEISQTTGVRMTKRRYSIPFFIGADMDTIVECVPSCQGPDRPRRYEAVSVGEYFKMRMNALY
ncbi:hypothetical protein NQ176_g5339 [Zarea fungicola]|uniref:Uncharacterized protein n=1 Tax=Zarea fungicola TaxID=93591 RepID=A0ACC1N9R9_9HYPO|nr:hypothetical protein NQ176_g5339 [Lecanicillium fungicola]